MSHIQNTLKQKSDKKLKIVYNLCDVNNITFFLHDIEEDLKCWFGGDMNTRISQRQFSSFLAERAVLKVHSFNNNKQDL